MESLEYDIVFIGAGLANGLAAYRLSLLQPSLKLLVVEQRKDLSRSQTWSFHDSDLTWNGLEHWRQWLPDFRPYCWDDYEVYFPKIHRTLKGRYITIRGAEFAKTLQKQLKDQIWLGREVVSVEDHKIVLDNQQEIRGRLVIDGRGWRPGPKQTCGFQKFVGMVLQLKNPHGLNRPVIMDARIAQTDGFRFMYVLPFTKDTLLVEDTRYSNAPEFDFDSDVKEIMAYCDARQWEVQEIVDQEQGCLPIPYWGAESPAALVTWPTSGMAGGLFHPTTGYSIMASMRFAEFLIAVLGNSRKDAAESIRNYNRRFWRSGNFY